MVTQRHKDLVLLVGDSHGNAGFLGHACTTAHEQGVSRVLQLGDFGIWPGNKGRSYLDAVSEVAQIFGVRVDFIDGNHEDHDALDEMRIDPRRQHRDGSVVVADHVHWWPRGSVARIGGRRFGFCGGAVSVDRHRRTSGTTWWPQEVIDIDDVNRLIDNSGLEALDVFVSHECPHGIELPSVFSWPPDSIRDAEVSRRVLTQAMSVTRPQLVVHGHWHFRYHYEGDLGWGPTRVVGMGAESDEALALLDCRTLEIAPLKVPIPTLGELKKDIESLL